MWVAPLQSAGRATVDGRPARPALGDDRLERPGQPDVLRHLRVPDVLRLLQEEGREADAGGAPEGQGRRVAPAPARRWSATCRPCTSTACGRRCSRIRSSEAACVSSGSRRGRGGAVIADVRRGRGAILRSLAAQLLELLRNRAPTGDDPLERALDFGRPRPAPTTRCSPGCSRRPTRRRGGGRRVPPLHRGDAARRQGADAQTVLDTRPSPGRVELDAGAGAGLAALAQRPAARARHPAGGTRRRRGARRSWPRTTPGRRPTSLRLAGLPPGDAWSRPSGNFPQHADDRAGTRRRDRRARPGRPPRRGVRRGRGPGGQRPPGAVRPDGQRRAVAHVLRVRLHRSCSRSTARWTTATRSRW